MRVLIVGPSPRAKGGISTLIRNMLHYSQSVIRYDMHVATSGSNFFTKAAYVFLAFLYFIFRNIFCRYKIIHIHSSENMGFYRYVPYVWFSKLMNKKVILHVNASKFDLYFTKQPFFLKRLITSTLNRIDLIITVGKEWAHVFKGLSNAKVEIVFNFINVPDDNYYNSQSYKVITTGYLGKRKGYYDLLEVIPSILNSYPDLQFVFCGNGEIDNISKIANLKNIADKLSLTGWLSNEKIHMLLKDSMIFVLPTYNEGMPLALLEAMSYGLPIITTPVGSIPSLVDDNDNGIIIEPGNINSLKNAILKLVSDEKERIEISKRNYKKVYQYYNTAVNMKRIHALYEEVLK